jgi:protein O-mannosyl-transferase
MWRMSTAIEAQTDEGAGSACPPSRSGMERFIVPSLFLLTLVCYANTLTNGFVYDDKPQVLNNPYVKNWSYLPQIFGTTVWSFVGAAGNTNYYRPMMTFTYLILWQVFGPLPYGFHLLSIALHLATALMVFFTGRRIFRDHRIAWCAGLFFAAHPIHTEPVAWIAGIPDLELGFFFLLAVWIFASDERLGWRQQVGLMVIFSLALLSKEPALMLIPVAILFEHGVRRDRTTSTLTQKFARYASLCALGAGYLLLRVVLFGKLAPVLQHPKISWAQAVYSALAMVLDYLRLLLWPAPLSAFHVFHVSSSLGEPKVLAGLVVSVLYFAGTTGLWRRAPDAAFSLLWIGVTLLPVLNARWMAANVLAERYLYLPSVGFCWFAGWAGVRLWDRVQRADPGSRRLWKQVALIAPLGLTAILLPALTIARNRVWRDDFTLYTRTLLSDPDAHVIRSNLAAVYFDRHELEQAEREWKTALAGKPDNVTTMDALGILYTQEGRYAEAEEMFKLAITTKPAWGTPYFNYGALLRKKGDLGGALQELCRGVELSPLNAAARFNYGDALLAAEHLDEAQVQYERAVDLEPSLFALKGLANMYIKKRRNDLAEPVLRRTIADYPYDSDSHFQIARILEFAGRREEARREFEAGLLTDPTNAEARTAVQRLREP